MIVVINYDMGNLRSIEKAMATLNAEFVVSNKIRDIETASHIIIPGVGSCMNGMDNLARLNLIDPLKEEVLKKGKYILGICLGMQILFSSSEEGGHMKGLGFIDADIKRFHFSAENRLKIPHIGWNEIFGEELLDMPIFKGIDPGTNFYFIHSYHAMPVKEARCCYTDYGYPFVAAIQKDNIFGTQFHPEKSQKKGLQLLKNFIELK